MDLKESLFKEASYKVIFLYSSRSTEKNQENLSPDIRLLIPDKQGAHTKHNDTPARSIERLLSTNSASKSRSQDPLLESRTQLPQL
jgi:hypothetical protein